MQGRVMDKFTKTTEMDISAMNEAEEEASKKNKGKSKIGTIISIILCMFVAVAIWLFAMESDDSLYSRTYKDINVNLIGNDGYEVSGDLCVDVVLLGTNSELADIEREEIEVNLDFSKLKVINFGVEQFYSVDINILDEAHKDLQCKESTVSLIIKEKQ